MFTCPNGTLLFHICSLKIRFSLSVIEYPRINCLWTNWKKYNAQTGIDKTKSYFSIRYRLYKILSVTSTFLVSNMVCAFMEITSSIYAFGSFIYSLFQIKDPKNYATFLCLLSWPVNHSFSVLWFSVRVGEFGNLLSVFPPIRYAFFIHYKFPIVQITVKYKEMILLSELINGINTCKFKGIFQGGYNVTHRYIYIFLSDIKLLC